MELTVWQKWISKIYKKKIEKDIFDEYNRVLEKFHSLISLIFASAGFSFTLIIFYCGKSATLREELGNYHISLCFLFLFLALLISIINVLAISHYQRLVKKVGSIGYRDGDELVNHNVKLHSTITKQKDFYLIAISLITFAFVSLFNSFVKHVVLTIMLTIGLVAELAL